MLSPGPATKVYLAAGATDLRAGFERLSLLAGALLGEEAASGHLFVFCNAARTRIRILFSDGSGLWLLTKKLLRGRYAWPPASGAAAETGALPRRLTLPHSELTLLLAGLDLTKTKRRDWWRREPADI